MYVFGDQTADFHPTIQSLYRDSKRFPILAHFLEETVRKVKDVLADPSIGAEGTDKVRGRWEFRSFLDWSNQQQRLGRNDLAAQMTLSVVAQLGCYLMYVFSRCLKIGDVALKMTLLTCSRATKSPSNSHNQPKRPVIGLCTGLLSAVAASVSDDLPTFLRLAPAIVALTARLGIMAARRADAVELPAGGSWALATSGQSLQQVQSILDDFHEQDPIPSSKKLYVSAITPKAITISGPPTSIAALLRSSERINKNQHTSLPISAPFHAPHLVMPDVETILGDHECWMWSIQSEICILSNSTGSVFHGSQTVGDLLRQVLLDILQKPMDVRALMENIRQIPSTKVDLMEALGPCKLFPALQQLFPDATAREYGRGKVSDLTDDSEMNHDSIAIVGMSGRFPGANSAEELWEVLESGKNMCQKIPSDRFDWATHCDPTGSIQNTTLTPYGCFIEQAGLFDARLFRMSPREAAQTDPIHRLMLMTAYEALEQCGYSEEHLLERGGQVFATFYGQSSDDWREVNAAQDIDTFHITGGNRAFGPGRINYHFGWDGPSMVIDAACSASALAIEMAYEALRHKKCDVALAGGANIMTASDIFAGLSRANFLSPTGSCKTWDETADGYCRADAVGSLVLKRKEDAIRDGDTILAVIANVSTNHSAQASSITHPDARAQEQLFRQVLQNACVAPRDVDYIEAHGTGTQAGDTAETTALAKVFGDPSRPRPLYIGSVKANVGHGEAASGVTSVIKSICMFSKEMIPPHIGITTRRNPKLPALEEQSIQISSRGVPFPASSRTRRILINNFNATGGNSSILLEDIKPPTNSLQTNDPRSCQVLAVSGATLSSYWSNLQQLATFVDRHPDLRLQDLSYTLTARKIHHGYRYACIAKTVSEFRESIDRELSQKKQPAPIRKGISAAFVFTGQGATYPHMGRTLFQTSVYFRHQLLALDTLSRSLDLPSWIEVITGSTPDTQAPRPIQMQLALVALEIALARLWMYWGMRPHLLIGHSLGEYASLCLAGVLSESDALYLVGQRALLLEEHCQEHTFAMLAVNTSPDTIQTVLRDESFPSCEIGCYNTEADVVVTGLAEEIELLKKKLHVQGVTSSVLNIPYAFHSQQMENILPQYHRICERIKFNKPEIPIASTLLGTVICEEGTFNASYLCSQTRRSVRFSDAVKACTAFEGFESQRVWLEIGPHPVCLRMIKSDPLNDTDLLLKSLLRNGNDWEVLAESLRSAHAVGFNISWTNYTREYTKLCQLIATPAYAFDLSNHWIQYEGDWCIRKHQTTSTTTSPQQAKHISLTVHRLAQQTADSWVFESEFKDPQLLKLGLGHVVHGSYLCPSSIYAEMVVSAAKYIRTANPSENQDGLSVEVSQMEVFKPLILQPDATSQVVQLSATRDHTISPTGLRISISSDMNGARVEHAHCIADYYREEDQIPIWNQNAYLFNGRMEQLNASAQQGKAHRMAKGMIYKIFGQSVEYSEEYQGIDDIVMDSSSFEATAQVSLNHPEGDYTYHPCWIDALCHISGFILHASELSPPGIRYISHGWKSLRFSQAVCAGKKMRTHVRMDAVDKRGTMMGHVHIFDGDEIVAVCEGIKFTSIKESVLATLLPAKQKDKTSVSRETEKIPKIKDNTLEHPDSMTSAKAQKVGLQEAVAAIASEMAVTEEELQDHVRLEDLGVDSLLSISILAKLQDTLQTDIPSSLFLECDSVGELKLCLQSYCSSADPSGTSTPASTESSLPIARKEEILLENVPALVQSSERPANRAFQSTNAALKATPIHLRGASGPSRQRLILFPDGSGSAASYTLLASVPGSYAITAFNSPLLGRSSPTEQSMRDVVCSYVDAILEFQPSGPYSLGGWSIGGTYAYEAARQLRALGHEIAHLVLIDAPCPQTMPPLPLETVEMLEDAGLFDTASSKNSPRRQNVRQHFLDSIGLLQGYTPVPFEKSRSSPRKIDQLDDPVSWENDLSTKQTEDSESTRTEGGIPVCYAIWAKSGLMESGKLASVDTRDLNAAQKWILLPRTKIGAGGWEELLPVAKCTIVDGNHFSLIQNPALGDVIDQIMTK